MLYHRRAHSTYCNIVQYNAESSSKKNLEHTNNYLMELNALRIFDLLKYKSGLSMYKANKNLLPKNVQNLFVHRHGHVQTRQT